MLHYKTQVRGRNDKNNFCRGTNAEIVYLGHIVFTFYHTQKNPEKNGSRLV